MHFKPFFPYEIKILQRSISIFPLKMKVNSSLLFEKHITNIHVLRKFSFEKFGGNCLKLFLHFDKYTDWIGFYMG